MNVALPAIVLFAVFLPGIVYRRHATLAGPFRRSRSLGDEATEAFVATVLIHAPLLALLLNMQPLGVRPNIGAALVLLARPSGERGVSLAAAVQSVTDHFWLVGAYFLGACVIARLAAGIVRCWTLSGGTPAELLSRQFQDEPGARRWAEWEGLFALSDIDEPPVPRSSRLRRFAATLLGRQPDRPTEAVIALVAVVVEFGREPFLYLGLLEGARFDDEGRLDRIELSSAYRRRLDNEPTPEAQRSQPPRELRDDPLEGFYRITGRRLILRADEFRTMNIDYFGVELVEAACESERPADADPDAASDAMPEQPPAGLRLAA